MFSGKTGCLLMLFLMFPLLVRGEALSDSRINDFMASMTVLQADPTFQQVLAEARQTRDLTGSVPGTMMISEILVALGNEEVAESNRAQARSREVVHDHGFSDLNHWAQTGDRILLALMNLQLGGTTEQLLPELDRIEESIHDNTYFSTEQKTRVLAMLAASRERLMAATAVPERDREAVRPFLAELQQVLDWQ